MGLMGLNQSSYYCNDSKEVLIGFSGIWISGNIVIGIIGNIFTLLAIPYAMKRKK